MFTVKGKEGIKKLQEDKKDIILTFCPPLRPLYLLPSLEDTQKKGVFFSDTTKVRVHPPPQDLNVPTTKKTTYFCVCLPLVVKYNFTKSIISG